MTVDLNIDNVALRATSASTGTIGSLAATLNWSSDGIKRTLQSAIPPLGGIISDVTTNPSDGTLALQSALGSVTVKLQIVDTEFALDRACATTVCSTQCATIGSWMSSGYDNFDSTRRDISPGLRPVRNSASPTTDGSSPAWSPCRQASVPAEH